MTTSTKSKAMQGFDPHVEVEITFVDTHDEGLAGPWSTEYRPQFFYDGSDWVAFFEFDTDAPMRPGQTVRANVCFLRPEAHQGRLYPGKEFELREDTRVVAHGTVKRLLSTK